MKTRSPVRAAAPLALVAALASGLVVLPASADDLTEDRVRELVLDTIRKNPDIVREAIDELQRREVDRQKVAVQDTIKRNRAALERDPNAPVVGNPDGSTTLVEFFDYNCPYCKRSAQDVKVLIGRDDDVRVVYREWPILSEGSLFAARAALAARKQGRYEDMHWAEESTVMKAAETLGLDLDELRADMKAPEVEEHIALSMQLAEALGIDGTPSFVIGEELVPGFVPLSRLEELVASAREAR